MACIYIEKDAESGHGSTGVGGLDPPPHSIDFRASNLIRISVLFQYRALAFLQNAWRNKSFKKLYFLPNDINRYENKPNELFCLFIYLFICRKSFYLYNLLLLSFFYMQFTSVTEIDKLACFSLF